MDTIYVLVSVVYIRTPLWNPDSLGGGGLMIRARTNKHLGQTFTLTLGVFPRPCRREGRKGVRPYLWDDGHLLAQGVKAQLRGQDAVDGDAPLGLGQAEQGRDEGALPRARTPHDANLRRTVRLYPRDLRS